MARGRITKRQQQAFSNYWSKYGLELEDGEIDYKKIFGRKGQVILEIGFGMGQSLLTLAENNPEKNYIGVEVYRPGIGALFAELVIRGIANIRVYCADAVEVLQRCIPANSLNELLLFFPDPWPKRAHLGRRIVQNRFVALVYDKLKPNGYFHIATDWEDYAHHIKKIMAQAKGFSQTQVKTRPVTKFEQKGRKLGYKIWDMLFLKEE